MFTEGHPSCIIQCGRYASYWNAFLLTLHYYYRPKRSFGQGNVFTPVCHSVNRGEYLIRHPPQTSYTPPGPGRYLPWNQAGTPPPGPDRYTPQGPGRYTPLLWTIQRKQQTPQYGYKSVGTHPTGMDSCFAIFFTSKFIYPRKCLYFLHILSNF